MDKKDEDGKRGCGICLEKGSLSLLKRKLSKLDNGDNNISFLLEKDGSITFRKGRTSYDNRNMENKKEIANDFDATFPMQVTSTLSHHTRRDVLYHFHLKL